MNGQAVDSLQMIVLIAVLCAASTYFSNALGTHKLSVGTWMFLWLFNAALNLTAIGLAVSSSNTVATIIGVVGLFIITVAVPAIVIGGSTRQ